MLRLLMECLSIGSCLRPVSRERQGIAAPNWAEIAEPEGEKAQSLMKAADSLSFVVESFENGVQFRDLQKIFDPLGEAN
jgi:Zn-dependent M32 family carboxypeptidase